MSEIFARKNVRRHWRSLFDDQDGICPLCDQPMDAGRPETIHVDHRIAVAKGGSNERSNLQAVHASCNLEKGDFGPWDSETTVNIGLGPDEEECGRCGGDEESELMHVVAGTGERMCPVCANNLLGVETTYDETRCKWVVVV